MNTITASVMIALGLFGGTARGQNEKNLIDRAVQAHSASWAAINTLQAKVSNDVVVLEGASLPAALTVDGKRPEGYRYAGEFWMAGSKVKIHDKEGPFAGNTIIKDLSTRKAYLLSTSGGRGKSGQAGGLVASPRAINSALDICDGMIRYLPSPVPPDHGLYVTLETAVSKATKVTAARETLGGQETVRLTLVFGDKSSRIEVWLSPSHNHLFQKTVTYGNGKPQLILDVKEFAEPQPGVYCPVQIERTLPELTRSVMKLTNVRVNQPIANGVFDTRLASGSVLSDQTDGKVYKIGADGKPGTVIGRIIPPTEAAPSVATFATPISETTSWWTWPRILLGSSILVGAMGLYLRWRRSAVPTV